MTISVILSIPVHLLDVDVRIISFDLLQDFIPFALVLVEHLLMLIEGHIDTVFELVDMG